MKIVSVNVGLPREVIWKGMPVVTAIFKSAVNGPVTVREMNLDGDRQADLTVHGGANKAVYGYAAEHYEYWQHELPHVKFIPGYFGENLTTEGLSEETLCIGDRLQVGSAVLMVTQPRVPCYKLEVRFDRDDMIKRFLASGRSGFYFSVLQEGEVSADSTIKMLSRDATQVSIADINRLCFGKETDPHVLQRAVNLTALPSGWKEHLLLRSKSRPNS